MSKSISKPLFTLKENIEVLRHFHRALKNQQLQSHPDNVIKVLRKIIELMISNAAAFDEHCNRNIEWIGDRFMQDMREFTDIDEEMQALAIGTIFSSAYRFICELEFMQPVEPSLEIMQIGAFVDENLQFFNDRDRQQITFAKYTMPVQIAKKLLNNPAMDAYHNFSNARDEAAKLKERWDAELRERSEHVESITEQSKTYTTK